MEIVVFDHLVTVDLQVFLSLSIPCYNTSTFLSISHNSVCLSQIRILRQSCEVVVPCHSSGQQKIKVEQFLGLTETEFFFGMKVGFIFKFNLVIKNMKYSFEIVNAWIFTTLRTVFIARRKQIYNVRNFLGNII